MPSLGVLYVSWTHTFAGLKFPPFLCGNYTSTYTFSLRLVKGRSRKNCSPHLPLPYIPHVSNHLLYYPLVHDCAPHSPLPLNITHHKFINTNLWYRIFLKFVFVRPGRVQPETFSRRNTAGSPWSLIGRGLATKESSCQSLYAQRSHFWRKGEGEGEISSDSSGFKLKVLV